MALSPPPIVNVIDLTARLGLYALGELGVTTTAESGRWPQIALGGVSVAPRLDWHRPAGIDALTAPAPDCAATLLLVGPGSARLLRAALALLAPLTDTVVWAFLMPNALMETTVFKALPPEQAARTLALAVAGCQDRGTDAAPPAAVSPPAASPAPKPVAPATKNGACRA